MPQLQSNFRIGLQLESHFTMGGSITQVSQRARLEAHLKIGALQATVAVSPVIVAQPAALAQTITSRLLMGGTVIINGTGGAGEPAPELARRVDEITDSLFYVGDAAVGKADSEPAWRIRKITINADDTAVTQYAGGSRGFDHAWENRATYEYL